MAILARMVPLEDEAAWVAAARSAGAADRPAPAERPADAAGRLLDAAERPLDAAERLLDAAERPLDAAERRVDAAPLARPDPLAFWRLDAFEARGFDAARAPVLRDVRLALDAAAAVGFGLVDLRPADLVRGAEPLLAALLLAGLRLAGLLFADLRVAAVPFADLRVVAVPLVDLSVAAVPFAGLRFAARPLEAARFARAELLALALLSVLLVVATDPSLIGY